MRIAEILRTRMTLSFEVFPPKEEEGMPKLQNELGELFRFNPDFISCTYGAGGTNVGKSVEICDFIVKSGVTCMSHFTCIGHSRGEIRDKIRGYLDRGVENFLALRGDFPRDPETGRPGTATGGEFGHANHLIRYLRETFGGGPGIACGGAPERHLLAVSGESDIAFLRAKQDAGAEFVMCQLCYDVGAYERWVKKCRRAGIVIPFVMGLMPVLVRDPVVNMALSNGCSIPSGLAAIIGRYTPGKGAGEGVVKELAADFKKAGTEYTVRQIWAYMNTDLQGIHLYTLNKSADVTRIVLDSGIRLQNQEALCHG